MRRLFLVLLISFVWVDLMAQQDPSLIAPTRVGSQILDDSTQNVYGPTSSQWTTEQQLFSDRPDYQPIDTTIFNYHRWAIVQRSENLYHDLGSVGTAINPIFPQLQSTAIGVSSGYRVYDPYFQSEDIKYFDTKSPYTRLYLVWGGSGRATTRIEFSRNINPRWNFGFNIRPTFVDKQIQRNGKGDRQTISFYYDAYTSFRTLNERYSILFNYQRMRHSVLESGGITIVGTDSTYQSLFDPNVRPKLTDAISVQKNNQFHLLQQVKWGSIDLYHSGTLSRQNNAYHEDLNQDPRDFYDHFEKIGKDSILTRDSTRFAYFKNEVGVKGRAGGLFYNGYYAVRSYHFFYKYQPDSAALKSKGLENYVGGRMSIDFDSLTNLRGETEWLLNEGTYRLQGDVNSRWIDGSLQQVTALPGFVQNAYRGSFDSWNNDFKNTHSLKAWASLKVALGPVFFSPGATFTRLKNYIYFWEDSSRTEQKVLPVQSVGEQHLFSPEFKMDLTFARYFHVRPYVIYSILLRNDDDALRVPQLFFNGQMSYENYLFNRNLQVQIGIDLHWQSPYTTMGYDPAIQQFYVQDEVTAPSFFLTDVFFNGKIKRGRFFVKYHNLVQLITDSGYLPTAIYPGQRNVVDFGFELMLFD